MKVLSSLLLAVSLAATSASAAERSHRVPSAQQLMARINAEGEKQVLAQLWADENTFEALLHPVEKGSNEWFSVWIRLRAYADAAAAESIDMSFARALPVATERVLKLVGHGLARL